MIIRLRNWTRSLAVVLLTGCAVAPNSARVQAQTVPAQLRGTKLQGAPRGLWRALPTDLAVDGLSLIDFLDLPAPGGPKGSKVFFAQLASAADRSIRENLVGYYAYGPDGLVLGAVGPVSANAAPYVCSSAKCSAPAVYVAALDATSATTELSLARTDSAVVTTLRSATSLGVDAASPAAVVVPASSTRVEEFAAYELQRHVQLVSGRSVRLYTERTLPPQLYASRTLFYVGQTNFARAVGLDAATLPDEGYVIRTIGNAVVLFGKETGDAAAPSAVTWNRDHSLRLRSDSAELRYEIEKRDALFAEHDDIGGTIELWLRDDCPKNVSCGASQIANLSPAVGTAPTLGIAVWNEGSSTRLTAFLDAGHNGIVSTPSRFFPKDGAYHHVTASYAPCTTEPTTEVCVSLWLDAQPSPSAGYHLAGTLHDDLQLSRPWLQRLHLGHRHEPGWNGSIAGLRVARQRTSHAEHVARPDVSVLAAAPKPTDTLVLDFTEGAGFPQDKVRWRSIRPPLPSRWGQRGTLHAAYELLERFFGVRWYMPGRLGLAYTPSAKSTLPTEALELALPLRYRHVGNPRYLTPLLHLDPDSPGEAFEPEEAELWALRMRLGGENKEDNHAYSAFEKHFDQPGVHPEWFSTYGPDAGAVKQPCFDDPNVSAAIAEYARTYAGSANDAAYGTACVQGDPARCGEAKARMPFVENGAFSLTPLDKKVIPTDAKGAFVESDCNYVSAVRRGLLRPNYPTTQFFSGIASNYVFDFYNRIAEQLDRTPSMRSHGAYVTGLAYLDYGFPPEQPIHEKVRPTVNFFLHGWGTDDPQGVGREQLTAWRDKMGARGYMGWTYLIDSRPGMNTVPSFEYRALATAAQQMLRLGVNGLKFETSHTWDRYTIDTYRTPPTSDVIEDFRSFRRSDGRAVLWDEWPLSPGFIHESGWNHPEVFNCKRARPAESKVRAYSPYCAKYNNANGWKLLDPLYHVATEPRSILDAHLDSYLLLQLMAKPTLDINASIDEYFSLFYGEAAPELQSFHESMAKVPRDYQITACDKQPPLNGHKLNQCKWAERVPRRLMYELSANIEAALTKANAPTFSEVHAKRVRAFARNVWCTMIRSYYAYDPAGRKERTEDPLHEARVCQDDPLLNTYFIGNARYVVD